jgi:ubiquinone biosynthesis protein UbiJ
MLDVLLPPLAALLNRGIHGRRDAGELCEALTGRSLVTRIDGLPSGTLSIRLTASHEGVALTRADESAIEAADAVIAGTPLELRGLMRVQRGESIRSGRVSFAGDIEVAEKFRELMQIARPDIEERLAEWVGEPAAFQLANLARDARDWLIDASEDLFVRTTEYLQDEARHVPTGEEMNEYCAAVDDVANDVARLEARINRISEPRA